GLTDLKDAVGSNQVKLGDILKLQTATPSSGLDATLSLFQLVEAFVQLANTQNFANASIPLGIPGLINGTIKIKVIEPPQLSAVGNPANIGVSPIEVHTAQVRMALSLNLPVLSSPLVNTAVNGLVSPLTDVLNNLLSLNLGATVNSLVCAILGGYCQTSDLKILSSSSTPPASKIDVVLGIASAKTKVTGYTCASDGSKTLSTESNTSLITVQTGDISASALDSPGSIADTDVNPLAVIDIGAITCFRPLLGLGPISCDPTTRKPFYGGGIGLKISTNATPQAAYP
ncbi:hypothetical protein HX867_34505, partial [Pseudomonas gingeri]|nr:hypothetical protein [Pseudomonas gingeri]